jgi:hypothetical protein
MRARISGETFEKLKPEGKLKIVSFFPIDKKDCGCGPVIKDWTEKFGHMDPAEIKELQSKGSINCPRAQEKEYKNYEIICGNCGDLIATISLKDEDIDNWCNLHYISEAKIRIEKIKEGKKITKIEHGEWHGCMAVNVSPTDGKLGFECACGNDTRDFRMAQLTNPIAIAKLRENMKGREFNKKDSKYILKEIK